MSEKKSGKPQDKTLNKLKSSLFSRGFSVAKLTLQTATSVAQHSVTTVFESSESKDLLWKKLLKNQASLISNELGELKGSLMKAGQMLSMYGEHFLPQEANELLKSLQSNSPPLAWTSMEPFLKKHLSPEKLALLEIDTKALASASMGQVHRARIKATGENIVLKIQYPNVDKAIDSDLKTLRTLLTTLKLMPQDLEIDPLFDEVRQMLKQETDYELEAQLTEEYFDRLQGDSRYVVPRVYREFSGAKVLATSYEIGVRVDDPLIQSFAQDRRNRLAVNFLDLYFKEIFQWGVVQTDPHSGNYSVRIDPQGQDKLVLFDFGATRTYSPDFLGPYGRMIKGALYNKPEMLTQAAFDLKFIEMGDNPDLRKIFEEFCFETVEPFIEFNDPRNIHQEMSPEGIYDWKNTTLPQRLSQKVFKMIRQFKWRTPPKEIIFLDRKTGGVFIFLSILRAKISGRAMLIKYLENF
jgi:predicted unusual protein kinase regulating ubiquinone biosynthesis (AarF/ABC1/UbiB family)